MADMFMTEEARDLLRNKHIAVIGGSNMRGTYKDLIWMLNDDSFIPYEALGEKCEPRFPDFDTPRWKKFNKKVSGRIRRKFHESNRDLLVQSTGLHPGRTYKEDRQYTIEECGICIQFKFVTRVWSEELEKWFERESNTFGKFDLILMNSVLWDVNRWGPEGPKDFKTNLDKLLKFVKSVMSESGIFIWMTAQPGSCELNSAGMETKGLEFQKRTTRYNVIEANFHAAHKVAEAGFDVIDLHYYFLLQQFRRNKDGIHWSPEANRFVTNKVLTHIALSNGLRLPGRNANDLALQRVKYMAEISSGNVTNAGAYKQQLQHLDGLANNMIKEGNWQEMQLPGVNQLDNNINSYFQPNNYNVHGMQMRPTGPSVRYRPY